MKKSRSETKQLKGNFYKVKMLKTSEGSPDGMIVNRYEKGKVYELPERLAKRFEDVKPGEKPRCELLGAARRANELPKDKDLKQKK